MLFKKLHLLDFMASSQKTEKDFVCSKTLLMNKSLLNVPNEWNWKRKICKTDIQSDTLVKIYKDDIPSYMAMPSSVTVQS